MLSSTSSSRPRLQAPKPPIDHRHPPPTPAPPLVGHCPLLPPPPPRYPTFDEMTCRSPWREEARDLAEDNRNSGIGVHGDGRTRAVVLKGVGIKGGVVGHGRRRWRVWGGWGSQTQAAPTTGERERSHTRENGSHEGCVGAATENIGRLYGYPVGVIFGLLQ
jgi:hypothetical protein